MTVIMIITLMIITTTIKLSIIGYSPSTRESIGVKRMTDVTESLCPHMLRTSSHVVKSHRLMVVS